MASKNISISESAYKRLKARKEENESFTDTINRLTQEDSLLKIAGILSNEEAEELREHVKKRREKSRDRIQDIASEVEE